MKTTPPPPASAPKPICALLLDRSLCCDGSPREGALPVRDRHRARPVSPVEEIDRGVEILPAVAVAVAVAARSARVDESLHHQGRSIQANGGVEFKGVSWS